jgi:DNA-binding NarL/FixJ family response regulator
MQAKLLLVDDHAIVRAGIRDALAGMPEIASIDELDNGHNLLTVLDRLQPDCLLIDLTMPAFDPIATIAQIRQHYPELKILVVSAYDDDIYVQGLLRIGVNGYHLKDQSLGDLRLAVTRVLGGEKWVTSRLVDQMVKFNRAETNETNFLTDRQRDILQLLYHGLDNRSIAIELGLSVKTVENHLSRIYKHLNIVGRLQAVNYLMQHPDVLASSGERESKVEPSYPVNTNSKNAILVVDDNRRYRYQLIKTINHIRSSALVYEAENTQQAIMFAQSVKPVLVFVDVVLGEENGIQCVRQLRKVLSKSRIILFSAYPDSEFHRLGIEAGAVAFLDKKNLDMMALQQILEDTGLL